MSPTEKQEISQLPYKYQPIGAWAYFGYSLLFALPVVGQIALLIVALVASNVNVRSYARSFFCLTLIIIIAVLLLTVAGGGLLTALLARIQEILQG